MTELVGARALCLALDSVLVPAGFLAGQGGDYVGGGGSATWCTGHDELSLSFPDLPQANQQLGPGTCVDLVVDVRPDGTFDRLVLEGPTLADTLRLVGLTDDADAVSRLPGVRVADGVDDLAAALRRLFGPRA